MKELKKFVKEGKAVFGFNSVIKSLKSGGLSAVVVSKNTPKEMSKKIEESSSGVEIEVFDGNNTMLGTACGKPFSISVLGIKKE